MQKPTLENLYLTELTKAQLKTLLPCYRKDVEELIVDRIKKLSDERNS